jgi:small subunit ribosomal protein S16
MGAKKKPYYRIVVADSESPRDGRFIEIIGNYDPQRDPAAVSVKEDRASEWLSKGALPTETVSSLFKKKGIIQ